ncbi:hypothetical protein VPH35_104747 [Triticum aestivum]
MASSTSAPPMAASLASPAAAPTGESMPPSSPCLASCIPCAPLGAGVPMSSASCSLRHGLLDVVEPDHDPLHMPPRSRLLPVASRARSPGPPPLAVAIAVKSNDTEQRLPPSSIIEDFVKFPWFRQTPPRKLQVRRSLKSSDSTSPMAHLYNYFVETETGKTDGAETPSTTHVGKTRSRTPNDRHLVDHVQLPSPQRRWSHQVPLRTNVNDYHRKNGTRKSEDHKYHDTDDMNVYGNSCNDKHVPLPPPRSREPLPSTLERARTTTSTTAVMRTSTSSTLHRTRTVPLARFEVSFRSCEDSFDYVRLSSSWTRSSSLRYLSLQVPRILGR